MTDSARIVKAVDVRFDYNCVKLCAWARRTLMFLLFVVVFSFFFIVSFSVAACRSSDVCVYSLSATLCLLVLCMIGLNLLFVVVVQMDVYFCFVGLYKLESYSYFRIVGKSLSSSDSQCKLFYHPLPLKLISG